VIETNQPRRDKSIDTKINSKIASQMRSKLASQVLFTTELDIYSMVDSFLWFHLVSRITSRVLDAIGPTINNPQLSYIDTAVELTIRQIINE